MKTKSFFGLLLLLAMTLSSAIASNVSGYSCGMNVPEMPYHIQMRVPRGIVYMGKSPADDDHVYYHEDSKMLYVFKSNYEGNPRMLQWNDKTDKRTQHPCPGAPADADNCTWSNIQGLGIESFLQSLHVTCASGGHDPNSYNKDILKTPANGCIDPNGQFNVNTHVMAKCCEGSGENVHLLDLNLNTMKCDEWQLTDPNLTPCSAHTDCSDSKGCLPQRWEDLFRVDGAEPFYQFVETQVEMWLEEKGREKGKSPGESCNHNQECASYSCQRVHSGGGKCEEKLVCRYAVLDEFAPDGVNCEEDLTKTGGVCKIGPGYLAYPGKLNEVRFIPEGQYGYRLHEDDKVVIDKAMLAARAMEVLYHQVPTDTGKDHDCFKLTKHIKEEIIGPTIEARKIILANFSREMKKIEEDFKKIEEAQEGNMGMWELHGLSVSENDIASRRASGLDNLLLMYRRNSLYMDYEQKMFELNNRAADQFFQLGENMVQWIDIMGSWKLADDKIVNKFNCRASYRRKPFMGSWRTKYHGAIKDRWISYYDVDMGKGSNTSVMQNDEVKQELNMIWQAEEEDMQQIYVKSFAIMDPLNLGHDSSKALAFDKFGKHIDLNKEKSTWEKIGIGVGVATAFAVNPVLGIGAALVAIFGAKTKQTRYGRKLNEENQGGLMQIQTAMKGAIKDYYKGLNPNGVTDFIYEPELDVGYEAKDCFTPPEKAACTTLKDKYETLSNYAMAQFIAWGHNDAAHYKNYFRNKRKGRPLLMVKLTTDTHNLALYYAALVQKRQEQNAAIQKAIDNIVENFMGEDTAGVNGGMVSGAQGGTGGMASGAGGGYGTSGTNGGVDDANVGGRPDFKNDPLRNLSRFHIDLKTGNPIKFTGSKLDNINNPGGGAIGGAGAGATGAGGVGNSALSARLAKMKAANDKAAKNGEDLAKREKAVRSALLRGRSGGASSGSGSGIAGGANSGFGSGSGVAGKKATLDDDGKNGASSVSHIPGGALGNDSKKGSGSGSGGPRFGSGYGSSDSSGGGYGGRDATGMSQEEKDNIMENYDRTRSKYNPNEDDTLFNVVSKAYVRNLDKILTRKKKEGDGN